MRLLAPAVVERMLLYAEVTELPERVLSVPLSTVEGHL
jgi:hypothetical protein